MRLVFAIASAVPGGNAPSERRKTASGLMARASARADLGSVSPSGSTKCIHGRAGPWRVRSAGLGEAAGHRHGPVVVEDHLEPLGRSQASDAPAQLRLGAVQPVRRRSCSRSGRPRRRTPAPRPGCRRTTPDARPGRPASRARPRSDPSPDDSREPGGGPPADITTGPSSRAWASGAASRGLDVDWARDITGAAERRTADDRRREPRPEAGLLREGILGTSGGPIHRARVSRHDLSTNAPSVPPGPGAGRGPSRGRRDGPAMPPATGRRSVVASTARFVVEPSCSVVYLAATGRRPPTLRPRRVESSRKLPSPRGVPGMWGI